MYIYKFLTFFFAIIVFNNIAKAQLNQKILLIEFEIDFKKQQIENDFNFYLIQENDTMHPQINGNKLIFSNTPNINSPIDVFFQFRDIEISFTSISSETVKNFLNQNYSWTFGLDSPPYSTNLSDIYNEDNGIICYWISSNGGFISHPYIKKITNCE